jgi:hypothetical protein
VPSDQDQHCPLFDLFISDQNATSADPDLMAWMYQLI